MKIDTLTGNTKEFATACYDSNSISELTECNEPDSIDMNAWGISPSEWLIATSAALSDLISDE